MCKKGGFTLVEMLFVVLIAAGILVFAVPAYKRVQEKADYNTALGILLEVSNAVKSLERDLNMLSAVNISFPKDASTSWNFSNNNSTSLGSFSTSSNKPWNQWLVTQYSEDAFDGWDTYFLQALFTFGYAKPVQDTKGYSMYINPKAADCGGSLPTGGAVSCMYKAEASDCYKGAFVLPDGTVQRIKGSRCND